MANPQEAHSLDVETSHEPSRKIQVTVCAEQGHAFACDSTKEGGITAKVTADVITVKVTTEDGVLMEPETVYEAGGATLHMKSRAQIDGDEATASETSSTTTFDARDFYTLSDGSLKRRSSYTDLQDVVATEVRVKWQKDIAEYDPFTKVRNSVLPSVDTTESAFDTTKAKAEDKASPHHGSDPGPAESPQSTIHVPDPTFDTAKAKAQDKASSHHGSDSETVESPQPEIHLPDPAFDNAKAKAQEEASPYHAHYTSDSESAGSPRPEFRHNDPAFDNAKAEAQRMIGTFATAYSSNNDRDGCPLEGGDNVDWRLEELLSLLLPCLPEQARTHLLSTNSLLFTACQQCICYVSEVRSHMNNQYETHCGHFKARKVPNDSSYTAKFQFLAKKKSGDEKITIVIYRGKQNSRPCFRDSAQHALKTQQSFRAIEDLEQSMKEMAHNEAQSRATEIAKQYFDLLSKKVKNLDVVQGRNKLETIEARLEQFVNKSTARNFNVGIQVLEFQAAKHLRPEHILRGGISTTFQCLKQLGILGCEKFLLKEYPRDGHRYRAALGPRIELYWDFANPQTEDWKKNLRKQLSIGSFLWQGVNWSVQHPDVDGEPLPSDPVYVTPNYNWVAFWLELKNYLEPEAKDAGDGTHLPMVHNIDLSTLTRSERRQYEMEQKKALSPLERHVYDLFSENYAKFPTTMRDIKYYLSRTMIVAMEWSSGPGAELIKLLYPVKHGKPLTTMDPKSNDATLFHCSGCSVYLPGLMFEDAQIKLIKDDGSGICLGCKWIAKEDEAVNSPEDLVIDARFETFLQQANPRRFANFFTFDPQKDRNYHDEIPQLPLMEEFLKVCPYALKGQACKIQECVMAVPKDFQPGKAVGASRTMKDREHPFLQPACVFALLNTPGGKKCVKMPGMMAYDEKHCGEFCHDERLTAQYTFSTCKERRLDHFFGRVNNRYSPTSTNLKEWNAYSEGEK